MPQSRSPIDRDEFRSAVHKPRKPERRRGGLLRLPGDHERGSVARNDNVGRPPQAVDGDSGLRQISPVVSAKLQCDLEVVAVPNRYFGPSVTVAGLISGGDILAALAGRDAGDVVMAPRCSLDAAGERFLDDATPARVQAALGRPLLFANNLKEMAALLCGDASIPFANR
jgi:hypothetical protein